MSWLVYLAARLAVTILNATQVLAWDRNKYVAELNRLIYTIGFFYVAQPSSYDVERTPVFPTS
jgi:DTW domain-containing protein YfiP